MRRFFLPASAGSIFLLFGYTFESEQTKQIILFK